MLLSKASEYAVRSVLYLASLQQEGYVSIREISDKLDISFHFLTKIFQKLTQAGILQSFRGPAGGIALARPAGQITLMDIVLAIDGPDLFTECVLGLPECGNEEPCPLHARWAEERQGLQTLFSSATVSELASDIGKYNFRLTTRSSSTAADL